MQSNIKGALSQFIMKEGQHKQSDVATQKHAAVFNLREQLGLLRYSAADWAGSHSSLRQKHVDVPTELFVVLRAYRNI